MSLEIDYYFYEREKSPLSNLTQGLTNCYELLSHVTSRLDAELVVPDICECHTLAERVNFNGNYYIGEGSVLYSGVTIIGPVYIGRNVEIMPGAVIRPYTAIGDNCQIGHGSELKHCVLFSGAKVASLAFVGDSVLGVSARVGSGTITANRKFNQSNVILRDGDVSVDTSADYFGLILGDSARVGANCVTQPGTHIGPNTWVYPMTNVRGFIPKEKRVYHPRDLVFEDNEVITLAP